MAKPQIVDPQGNPISSEMVRVDREQRFNPCVGLTPDRLAMQLVAYARGEVRQLAWTMEWMEQHDDLILSVAGKAKKAVSRYGYDIVELDDIDDADSALAEEQADAVKDFFHKLEVGHATDLDSAGKIRLLMEQIMDGYGKGYAAHHIVWQPKPDGLSAKIIQVPLWFFEGRQGRLQFLRSRFAWEGSPLDDADLGGRDAWMISRGRGAMIACSICWIFRHIPLQDWLTYCDRHGMPGFIGKTTQAKGSPGWNSMVDAVRGIGSEYGAVVNTGDVIEVLDLTAAGNIPYPALVERMDRAISILWRGGDLATMSRGSGAVGSNPQESETDELDADNALWCSETIDRHLTRRVIDWHFGADAPMLVSFRARTKSRENVKQDLEVVSAGVGHGLRISQSWFAEKFGLPLASDDEEAILGRAATAAPPPSDPPATGEDDADDIPATTAAAANERPDDDLRGLITGSVAEAMRLRAEALRPAADLIDELTDMAADGAITDAELIDWLDRAAERLPAEVNVDIVADLAARLEADMGAAAIAGARQQLRDAGISPDPATEEEAS